MGELPDLQGVVNVIFWNLRVLVVDDDALTRTYVSELLRRAGIHQIEEAADGKSALVSAIKFQPDIIFSDIHMEPMGGIEFVKQLRSLPNPTVAKLRVIMMTADTGKEILTEVLPLGIRGYIIKPLTLEGIKAKIQVALR
jgi:two-component system chemotaxis response regulator CheY